MQDKKPCLVATLGLLEHEITLIKSIFRVSGNRDHVPYKLINENLAKAHIIIAAIDNEAAMNEWQKLVKHGSSAILLAVSPKELGKFPDYSFSRPFSPVKVLEVLDLIFEKELSHLFKEQIFHSENSSKHRVFLDSSKVAHGKHRALVVDDSKTVQTQLQRELTSSNIQADIAETGEQGLEMIAKAQYDIVFLDVVLPGVDGYQVCKDIRRNLDKKDLPVVMLTSKSSPFDKVRGSMAGCSSYLTKPVDYEKFHQVLEQYILHKNSK
jgi:two-component system, cell cycle response regulator